MELIEILIVKFDEIKYDRKKVSKDAMNLHVNDFSICLSLDFIYIETIYQ